MPLSRREPGGFTLIELLVVIAIIAVLVGLLLPAVQAARRTVRRIHCANNLMQLGLAVKTYEATHEVLPPGVVNPTGPIKNKPNGYHVSWMVQILPFIEQDNLFNELNFSLGVYDSCNQVVRDAQISVLKCTEDPSLPTVGAAASSYAGCHHDVEAPIAVNNNGVFFLNSKIRLEDIRDGSSNTIFIGEKRWESGDLGWVSGTRATLRNTGTPMNTPIFPTAKNPDPVGGFGSYHGSGANFMLGDGSIRFISSGVNPSVYQRLGNRADGKFVSDDDF